LLQLKVYVTKKVYAIEDEGEVDLGMDEIGDLVEDLEFGRSGG